MSTKNKRKKSQVIKFLEQITGSSLSFGNMLSSVRQCDEISQADFAKKLGISASHLSDLEHERKTVSPERALKFAKVLGYSKEQFVRLSLQDTLNRKGISFRVSLEAA